jgi:RNA-binding protein
MKEIGEVLHKAKSGRLIIKLGTRVEPGSVLLDVKGRKAAKVVELIGPVVNPYASAIPASDREGKDGQKLYSG